MTTMKNIVKNKFSAETKMYTEIEVSCLRDFTHRNPMYTILTRQWLPRRGMRENHRKVCKIIPPDITHV